MELALDEYRSYVHGVARGIRPSEVIRNRTTAHAAIIFAELFDVAERSFRIVTGNLNPNVYGASDVIVAACGFLTRSPTAVLEIVSEKRVPDEHPLLSKLFAQGFRDRVRMSVLPQENGAVLKLHFAVADGQHFRIEADKTKFEALVQFGNSNVGAEAESLFQELLEACEPATELVPA